LSQFINYRKCLYVVEGVVIPVHVHRYTLSVEYDVGYLLKNL